MGLTKANFYRKPDVELCSSWDDGGSADIRVASMLEKYGMKGTFYIVLDYVGTEEHLSWEQIKDLDKRGHKIGSHTISHPNDLKKLHDEALWKEIQSSKDLIETALGHNIESFCYPRGRADERVKEEVARAGYVNARTTGKPGITTKEDAYFLPGTIHIFNREEYGGKSIEDYAREVIDKVSIRGGYINIWGHSEELDKLGLWGTLENVIKYAKEKIIDR